MLTPEVLDDYRPYYDSEVPEAIQRIAQDVFFPQIIQFLFPEKKFNIFLEDFKTISTVDEFQEKIMFKAVEKIINLTISKVTYTGLEHLSNNKTYMFIANHRDIVLDSAILQAIFVNKNLKTSEITFGSNLMKPQFVVDIGKLNKMFKIIREGKGREVFVNSLNVSKYMRYTITTKQESTWIAQRNGRTKDGNDITEMAVLKMFAMSSKKPFIENLLELNITPVTVSYEYEPCDFLKAREVYLSRKNTYIKESGEDLNSILQGIKQFKGNTHFSICKTITESELAECTKFTSSNRFKELARIIDNKIYSGYKLWKTNYIAHDILHNDEQFTSFYSQKEKEDFIEYMNTGLSAIVGDFQELKEIFLGIYANPVDNCSR